MEERAANDFVYSDPVRAAEVITGWVDGRTGELRNLLRDGDPKVGVDTPKCYAMEQKPKCSERATAERMAVGAPRIQRTSKFQDLPIFSGRTHFSAGGKVKVGCKSATRGMAECTVVRVDGGGCW